MSALLATALLLTGCTTPLPPAPPPSVGPVTEGAPAASDAPATPTGPLTVAAAIQRALDCNAEITTLRAALSVAEQRKRAATDITDPELGLAWGQQTVDGLRERHSGEVTDSTETDEQTPTGTDSTADHSISSSRATQTRATTTTGYSTEDTDGYRIGIRLFVPNPWQIMPRLSARRAEIQAAQADLQAAEWRVACDVRRLFNDLAYLAGDEALATELARLSDEILETTRARVVQGAATTTDLMTAVRRDLQAQNELDTLSQRHATARRDLGVLLTMSLDSKALDIPELKPPVFPPEEIEAGSLERLALLRRADIAALHWRKLAAQAFHREARNVRLPWIKEVNTSYRAAHSENDGTDTTAGSSYETATTYQSTIGASEDSVARSVHEEHENGSTWIDDQSDSEEWQIGVAVDIPIFSWLKNHADDVLRAEATLAEVRETDGQRMVRREIGNALDEWRESRRQQKRYDRLVEPLIAEMQQTAATLEDTPGAMPDQVAAAKAQVIESKRFKLMARHRACQAVVGLENALGIPLQEVPAAGAGVATHQ